MQATTRATPAAYASPGVGPGGSASRAGGRRQPVADAVLDCAAQVDQAPVEEVAGLRHADQFGRVRQLVHPGGDFIGVDHFVGIALDDGQTARHARVDALAREFDAGQRERLEANYLARLIVWAQAYPEDEGKRLAEAQVADDAIQEYLRATAREASALPRRIRVDRLILDSVVDPDDRDPFGLAGFRAMGPSLAGLCPGRCRGIAREPVAAVAQLRRRTGTPHEQKEDSFAPGGGRSRRTAPSS